MVVVNKIGCLLFMLIFGISCTQNKESKKQIEKVKDVDSLYVLSEDFDEQEYIDKVQKMYGDKLYFCAKDSLHNWNMFMVEVDSLKVKEGDVLAIFNNNGDLIDQGVVLDTNDYLVNCMNFENMTKINVTFNEFISKMNKGKYATHKFFRKREDE